MSAVDPPWKELEARLQRGEFDEEGLADAVDRAGLAEEAGAPARLIDYLSAAWNLLRQDPGVALARARIAEAVAERLDAAPVLRAELSRRRSAAHFVRGETRASGEAARRGLALLSADVAREDPFVAESRSALLSLLANASLADGRREEALVALEEAIALARRHSLRGHLGIALTGLGNARLAAGAPTAAAPYYEEALELARERSDPGAVAVNLGNLGLVHQAHGRLRAAEDAFEEALGQARRAGDRQGEASLEANLGALLLERGALEAAQRRLEASLRLSRTLGDARTATAALVRLASVLRERGALPEASRALDAAGRTRAEGAPADDASLLSARGELCLARREASAAGRCFARALEAARAAHDPRGECSALLGIGRARLAEDDLAEALAALDAARTLADEVEEVALAAEIETARADALARRG
ncbi:MAG: hypothetical protein D6731_02110, partial [Planctomycetota bacterium]